MILFMGFSPPLRVVGSALEQGLWADGWDEMGWRVQCFGRCRVSHQGLVWRIWGGSWVELRTGVAVGRAAAAAARYRQSFWNHHQSSLTTGSLQTAEHLQGTSSFYQKISAFLTSTWLPDLIWWRDELASHFQKQLCPLVPAIPSVLLSNIIAVNPDPQVLYTSAWTSGNFLIRCSKSCFSNVYRYSHLL